MLITTTCSVKMAGDHNSTMDDSKVFGQHPRQTTPLGIFFFRISPNQFPVCSRQHLIRRLRETLVESTSVIGVARPLEAIMINDIVMAVGNEDIGFSGEDWNNDTTKYERGIDWL